MISKQFDDIYFNQEDGIGESIHNFIKPNDIQNRCNLTIGELGFGSGLNFLLTLSHAQKPFKYISIEKFPLDIKEITQMLSEFEELDISKLIEIYPKNPSGVFKYQSESFNLEIYFCDVIEALNQIDAQIDAWYLDGFAPSKNPQMWELQVFNHMHRLSSKNATFSSFTAASKVKKDLEAAGFKVFKQKGFKRKREMIYGGICQKKLR